jgi:hypothetical protein
MSGPARGYRTPVPVNSAPELIVVVGRESNELIATDNDPAVPTGEPRLIYGTAAIGQLRQRARDARLREVSRVAGLPYSTVSQWSTGRPIRPDYLARIITAIDTVEATPKAAPPCAHCGQPASRRWCSDRCRKAATRAAARLQRPPLPGKRGAA